MSTLWSKNLECSFGIQKIFYHNDSKTSASSNNDTFIFFIDRDFLNEMIFINIDGKSWIPYCFKIVQELTEFEFKLFSYFVSVYFGPSNVCELRDFVLMDSPCDREASVFGIVFLANFWRKKNGNTVFDAGIVIGDKTLLVESFLDFGVFLGLVQIESGVGSPNIRDEKRYHL